jgi:hypothetical protein
MTAYANGRLPRSVLAPITRAVNGQQAYLIKAAAASFNAMNAESERRFGVTLRVASARVAYRSRADQDYFWDLYLHHGGALAARPGFSNHGLGLAVDFATPQMRAIVDRIGRKYGWAKAWSDAPSEWWHEKWRVGTYAAVRKPDPLAVLTPTERRWCREYDRLRSSKSPAALTRRRSLRRAMTRQRKAIFHAAGGAHGKHWTDHHRRQRYRSLLARTR